MSHVRRSFSGVRWHWKRILSHDRRIFGEPRRRWKDSIHSKMNLKQSQCEWNSDGSDESSNGCL